MSFQMPYIHPGVTDVDTLFDENLQASRMLDETGKFVVNMTFHPRDYKELDLFDSARQDRARHLSNLVEAREYFLKIAAHCDDVRTAREQSLLLHSMHL